MVNCLGRNYTCLTVETCADVWLVDYSQDLTDPIEVWLHRTLVDKDLLTDHAQGIWKDHVLETSVRFFLCPRINACYPLRSDRLRHGEHLDLPRSIIQICFWPLRLLPQTADWDPHTPPPLHFRLNSLVTRSIFLCRNCSRKRLPRAFSWLLDIALKPLAFMRRTLGIPSDSRHTIHPDLIGTLACREGRGTTDNWLLWEERGQLGSKERADTQKWLRHAKCVPKQLKNSKIHLLKESHYDHNS